MLHMVSIFIIVHLIKVPSHDNPEPTPRVLPLKPERSEYGYTYFAHCQEFVPCPNFYFPSPFALIIFKSSPYLLTALVLANTVSPVGPQNKTGHLAHSCK